MLQHTRNFSIIAHIDHGKSTLADRIIHLCGGLSDREMEAQVLDSMDIERERGITIKAQTAALKYTAKNGETYNLNLIDTPGHVDFSAETERVLAVLDYAILVVSGADGIQGHTETLWRLRGDADGPLLRTTRRRKRPEGACWRSGAAKRAVPWHGALPDRRAVCRLA